MTKHAEPSIKTADKARWRPTTVTESLNHFKALVNAVGCIVWEGDPDTYAFTFVSDQAEKLLGFPVSRWIDDPTFWVDHIHPEDREWVLRLCVGETQKGCSHEFEYRMIASDGRVVWLKDIVTVVCDQGRPVWSQGVMIDVTARKELELELAAQNERLRHLDVLKNELVNTASHELRTPLASIRGFAEFLEDELAGPLTDGQREFVGQIQQGVGRLQGIIDDMLDFARLEADGLQLSCREIELGQLVRAATESLRPQAQTGDLALALEAPDAPVLAKVDPPRIEQVMLNLVGNAIKFTPAGGQVNVRLAAADGQVRVEVADTGIGLADEHHERVFDKFYQVDASTTRPYGGAGLGLAIAKALVEAHGGQIGLDSRDGGGSTFWFTLPL